MFVLQPQDNAEVVVCLGEVVQEADGLADGLLRLLVAALVPKDDAEHVVRLGGAGQEADGLAEGLLCLPGAALVVKGVAALEM